LTLLSLILYMADKPGVFLSFHKDGYESPLLAGEPSIAK
jgi:hypothetical protein